MYRKFLEIKTTLRDGVTMIIGKNNLRKIWATLDLSLVIIKILHHYNTALSAFSKDKKVLPKKCPKLLRMYGKSCQSNYDMNGHWW